MLLQYTREGFPEHRSQLPDGCRKFWGVRNQLSLENGLIVYGCRLFIPRREVLSQLHESHQGSVRTKSRARLIVYWHGLDNDLDNIVLSCKHCQERLPPLSKEPILLKPKPTRPFQEIALGFCTHTAHEFLIVVDCFSDWPEIINMGTNTAYSLPSSRPSAAQALQISFGQTEVPNLLVNFSMIFLWSGASSTTRLPPEQRQSRSDCQVHEDVDPSSLDRLTG